MIKRHHFREDGLVLGTGVAGSICRIQPIDGKEYYMSLYINTVGTKIV